VFQAFFSLQKEKMMASTLPAAALYVPDGTEGELFRRDYSSVRPRKALK
jgi:hypothetical protein